MPSSLTSAASSKPICFISSGMRRLITVVTPLAFRSRSAFSVGWPPMNRSLPTMANFAWKSPVMSRLTGSGAGPVLPLPTTDCAAAGSDIETISRAMATERSDRKVFIDRCYYLSRRRPSLRSERMLQRLAGRGQKFGAGRGDVHVVFEPDPEFTLDVDAWLVAEDHAGLQRRVGGPAKHVVLHQVRPLVHVHPHAMADTMR